MNESDKNWLMISYHDIRAKSQELIYSMGDGSNVCMSLYVKIHELNDFICYASKLFEDSAVSECSDYKRFYVKLRKWCYGLQEYVDYLERKNVSVDSVIRKGIESLLVVVFRDEALFGYSEEEAHEKANKEVKRVPGSYFTQYDFTLPVSIRSQNE